MKLNKRIIAIVTTIFIICSLLAGCVSTDQDTTSGSSAVSSNSASDASKAEDTSSAAETEKTSTGDKTLKLYVWGFQNLDPQLWTWGTHVSRMGIFEGLTQLNSDFTTRLANAESIEHNDDYTVWTVKLRQDLQWSDGTPLNANDYYYSFERIIDPQYLAGKSSAFNTNPPILNALECQKGEVSFDEVGIAVIDDYTIEFTLDTPSATFDVRLAESWALPVPKHVIEEFGDDWTKPENIVVNGPYIPTAREEDVHLTLEPNSNYYETPALEKIDLYYGTQNQLLAYKNGDVNIAMITEADIDAVNADTELAEQLQTFETSVVTFIGLLKGQNTFLQDNPKVRKAISLSIDRETIAKDIKKDTVTPAYSLIYPGFASWVNDLGIIEYNVEEAQRLMEEAGYPNGEGIGEMTCLIAGTADAATLAIVDMIQRGTGIKVKIVNQEWAAYVKDRNGFHEDDTFGIYIDGWNTSVAEIAGAFANYQCDIRVGNLSAEGLKAFAEAEKVVAKEEAARQMTTNETAIAYAEKYEQLLKEGDPDALEAGYKELEIMRLEDASSIPLYWSKSVLLIDSSVQGFEGNPLLHNSPFYFKDISNG